MLHPIQYSRIDFELTQPNNRVALRAFDPDNQTSDWVYLDVVLVPADEEEPGGGGGSGGGTTPPEDGLVELTSETSTFSSLSPKIAMF